MATATEETFEFKTEIKELMHLIVHTLYTHKEIFLRELLSNATDALSKVQFRALTDTEIYDKDQALGVEIKLDQKKKTITIEDTGVGMTRAQLIEQIGTVAHSGTKKFMSHLAENKDKKSLPELIGQFGVGFYSVFMVADKVTLHTRSLEKEEQAICWESDGSGSYLIKESPRRKRGTEITLHLKKEAKEYLEEARIKELVKQYSNYLPFPVRLGEDEINSSEALWRRNKSDLEEKDYHEFYKQVATDWQEPLFYEHFAGDAPVQFSAVLYVPKSAPMDFYGQDETAHGLKLYVKRVFIQDDCKALIPKFLRFLKGVASSEDLPLNVSREVIQNDVNITKINKVLTKKFLSALNKRAKKDEKAYQTFFSQFGRYIKEGIYGEPAYKDKLLPLLRFHTTKNLDEPAGTLASYVAGKREDQKAIYYAVGEKIDQLRRGPHLELFLKNDIEVILLTQPMDDMVFNTLGEYQDMKFINVESGDLQLPEQLEKDVAEVKVGEDLEQLKDKVRTVLQDRIKEVRFSKALSDSPCRFYNADGGMSHSVRSMMQFEGMGPIKRDLELNPEHQFIQNLAKRLDNESIQDQILMLFHLASLLEGGVEEPQELAALILPLLR